MDVIAVSCNAYPNWKRAMLTVFTMTALAYCGSVYAQDTPCEGSQTANNSSSSAWQDAAGKRREAILEEMKEKLGKLHATDNVDYDFAVLQQMYADTAVKMAQEELHEGHDREMRSHAKRVLKNQAKDRKNTDLWIEQFRRFN